MNRYEQTLQEMEEYIEGCKRQKFSDINIIVNRDELHEYMNELSTNTPEEIKKYRRIINNRDAILSAAQVKAEEIMAEANNQREQMVAEHEIMQQAQEQGQQLVDDASEQAQQILDKAVADANDIRTSVMQYADDTLANIQTIVENAMDNINEKYDAFMKSLSTSLEVLVANRNELTPAEETVNYDDADDDVPELDDTDIMPKNDIDDDDYEDYTVDTTFLG